MDDEADLLGHFPDDVDDDARRLGHALAGIGAVGEGEADKGVTVVLTL